VGLLAVVLGAAGAWAQAVRITGVPAEGVLGDVRDWEVRVEAGPDATRVEVFASEGEVGPVTPVAPGLFRAAYVPPRQRLPREVVLTALARGPQGPSEAWGRLSLWGRGEAEVNTRPHAPVTLRVGALGFGPVRADDKGLARVPLTVPPGHLEAFFGTRRIELGVPPWPWVHAVVLRGAVRADREETVEVRLYRSRLEGTPEPPAAFAFTASHGTVGPAEALEPGVWRVRWTVPPGPAGEVTLRGGVGEEPRWALDARVRVEPGPPPSPGESPAPRPVARRRDARVSLAPHVGGLTNFADVRAPSLGLRLEMWPVRAWPALGVLLDTGVLGFWREGSPVVPDFSGQALLFDTSLAVGLRSPWMGRARGWVAGGLSLARVRARSAWGGGLSLAEATWVPGVEALAGVGVALGPGQPFLEARVRWFDDPALHVLRGALGGAGLHLGYRLDLF
jgi:hypothetical protein